MPKKEQLVLLVDIPVSLHLVLNELCSKIVCTFDFKDIVVLYQFPDLGLVFNWKFDSKRFIKPADDSLLRKYVCGREGEEEGEHCCYEQVEFICLHVITFLSGDCLFGAKI